MVGGGVVLIFGHDLLNAYGVRHSVAPSWPHPVGLSFWYHLAMNFRATASVWNFNRGGDALQQLFRGLLLLATGHYVDDLESRPWSPSSMNSWGDVEGHSSVAKEVF